MFSVSRFVMSGSRSLRRASNIKFNLLKLNLRNFGGKRRSDVDKSKKSVASASDSEFPNELRSEMPETTQTHETTQTTSTPVQSSNIKVINTVPGNKVITISI